MNNEKKSQKDDLVQRIGELAKHIHQLAHQAVVEYSVDVEAIIEAQSRDTQCIERCLDGMLDFCFDDDMLALYKRLCRYYFRIDPEATVFHIQSYREMWDE